MTGITPVLKTIEEQYGDEALFKTLLVALSYTDGGRIDRQNKEVLHAYDVLTPRLQQQCEKLIEGLRTLQIRSIPTLARHLLELGYIETAMQLTQWDRNHDDKHR